MKLTIGYLYPELMNIYGDAGNIIALKKRVEWRGIEVEIKNISIGDKLKTGEADIFFFGGGQDQAQELVARDLVVSNKGKIIKQEVERGVPLLSICGGYQLLGEFYQPHDELSLRSKDRSVKLLPKGNKPKLPGVGLFPAHTIAGEKRMIGNIVVAFSNPYTLNPMPYLVGFENHSGKTYLKDGTKPLGKVITGFGNNGEDQSEGCIYKNAIGTYLHGSLLPKNPHLADWLLTKALETKYGKKIELEPLDDALELQAHQAIISKFC